MAPRLPPFSALRALEAAARLQSYSRAADELHVTHGAVSQQIRKLEEEFDLRLFRRDGGRMVPSEAALKLAARVSDALRGLERGVAELQAARSSRTLVLSTLGGVAGRWLAPRLHRFAEAFPGVELEVRTDQRLADFTSDGVDVALRYGSGSWPGAESVRLLEETLFPVASPAFLEAHPVRTPADLLSVPLMRHREPRWALWFRSAGVAAEEPSGGMVFDDTSLLLDAASAGLGVALARGGLAAGELEAGSLVRLFADEVPTRYGYFIVWRGDSRKLALVERFRDWLLGEAANMESLR